MAIVFPASPSVNDTFTEGSITYKWDGAKWIGLGVTPADRLVEGSNSLEITAGNDLVWTGDNVGIGENNPGEKLVVQGPVVCKGTLSAGQTSAGVLDFSGNDLRIRCYGATTGSGAFSIRTGGGAGNADTERLRITSGGEILTAGAADVPLTSAGGIDACSGLYSVVIGGNSGGGSNQNQRTDGGNKEGRLVSAHKTNAEEPVSIATIFNLGTQNLLYFGGGSSLVNAATDIAFFTAANTTTTGGTERLRIDSGGRIAQGGRIPTSHGSPNLLLWGADTTLHITSTGSTNNSSFAGIKFAVAGGSTGDYSKAGIFVQRQDSYNDLDMIFAFRATSDAAGVEISDEKLRITSAGMLTHSGGHTNNSGGTNMSAGVYNRINAFDTVPVSSNRTYTFTGLASGWMTIKGGGYSNAGQSQFAVMYQLGGYMTSSNKFDVVTLQSWGSGATISVSKNAQSFDVTITNNSATYELQTWWCVEGSNSGIKVVANA